MSERTFVASLAMPLTLCSVCALTLMTPLLSACGTKTPLALPDRPPPPTLLDGLLSSATQPIATQAQAPVSSASVQEARPGGTATLQPPTVQGTPPSASDHAAALEASPSTPSTSTPPKP